MFQQALKHQKNCSFDDAKELYKELFRIDIISNELVTSPLIRTLRYLAHRNRGLLYFDELRKKIDTIDPLDAIKILDNSVEDLVNSLVHNDGDNNIINLLIAIFKLFGKERLSRFTVEYELTKEDNEDVIINVNTRMNAPVLRPYLNELTLIKDKLSYKSENVESTFKLPDVSFLQRVKKYLDERQQDATIDRKKCIELSELSVKEILSALSLPLSRSKAKYQRFMDAYQLREDIIVDFKFEIPEDISPKPKVEATEIKSDHNVEEVKRQCTDEVQQRVSKRTKTSDDDPVSNDFLSYGQRFLSAVGSLLGQDIRYPLTGELAAASGDFVVLLNNWNQKCSMFLLDSSQDHDDLSITEIINSNSANETKITNDIDETSAMKGIKEFVEDINKTSYSYSEVRIKFLQFFMSKFDGGGSLIERYFLGPGSYAIIEGLVIAVEDQLLDIVPMVSVLEVLLEYLLRLKLESKTKGINGKQLQDIEFSILHVDKCFLKWLKHLEEVELEDKDQLRLKWCKLLYIQHLPKFDLEFLQDELSLLVERCEIVLDKDIISFVNFNFIPSLSTKSIKSQKDKIDLITTFEKTLNSNDGDNSESEELLEALLLDSSPRASLVAPPSMKKLVNESGVGPQLRLWKTLLRSYAKRLDYKSYTTALFKLFGFLLKRISGDSYSSLPEVQRTQTLLTVLGSIANFLEELLSMMAECNWNSSGMDQSLMPVAISIFEIVYPFCLQEVSKTDTKPRFVLKLRDLILNVLSLIILLNNEKDDTSIEVCIDLLSVIHEEIGRLKFCDASSGKFLQLSQNMLKTADPTKFEYDILQHLNCRFHISISSENFTPFDHGTSEVELDITSSIQFSNYLFSVLSKKKDPLVSIPKPDLKSALDSFYEAIGDPDLEDSYIFHNKSVLDQFLAQPLDLPVLKSAFCGDLSLDFRRLRGETQKIISQGLYYLEAAANLNMFKARKKQAQGKASDLENVVKQLTSDLLSGTNRMETWLLLGEAYSLQVEDDLTWTSDKLNSLEKKNAVATTQKKSILCYSVALSMFLQQNTSMNSTGARICNLFSKELYHSLMKPLDKYAFLGTTENSLLNINEIIAKRTTLDNRKANIVIKLALKLIKMSLNYDQSSWVSYFYLAKVLHKLHQNPLKIINASLKSCSLNYGIIDSGYQLCSFIHKYYTAGMITESKGADKLKEAKLFSDLPAPETLEHGLSSLLILALRRLISLDKKKWHHRPKYRIAKIYCELGEYRKAADEMETFVLLKSMNKSLINIWKTDMEAPGKHFVYTYQYCLFYINISGHLCDIERLSLFIKKLRRFGASIIDLPDAWDKSCNKICYLMRQLLHVDHGYTDVEVPKLLYSEFMVRQQKLTDMLENNPLSDTDIFFIVLLYEISEVRRMNNGFGATSLIDDTLNAVYLKYYLRKLDDQPELQVTASGPPDPSVKTKVARRDIITAATTMLKKLDTKIKDYKIAEDGHFKIPEDMITELRSLDVSPVAADVTASPRSDKGLTSSPNERVAPATPSVDADNNVQSEEETFHTPQATPSKLLPK